MDAAASAENKLNDVKPSPMSAFGPKRTSLVAPHMSAFRGKADMTIWACLLLRSLLGVKRTWVGALHMSAFDPKRTSAVIATHRLVAKC